MPSFRALASFTALFAAGASAGDYASASSPLMLWSGRPSVQPSGQVAFDWESTAVSFSIAGVGATATLIANVTLSVSNAARVSVYINDYDAANLMLHCSTSSYLLAASLSAPVNNVTVHYAFEPGASGADFSAGRFVSFVAFSTSGTFVAPTPLGRRIDIIGDSITAGSGYDKLEAVGGALSLETGCHPWAPVTGYSQAYNWETHLCRYFRANCTTVAWSGGVLVDPAVSHCNPRPYLPALYTKTFATDWSDMAPWDFSRASRPDAVVVYLGTNDYSCSNVTDALFEAAYVALLHNVTHYYAASPPPASGKPIHFFCTVGLMAPTRPLAAVLSTIAAANAAGLSASLLDMRNGTADGCGGHPGPIGHWEMALQAAPQIEQAMGWAPVMSRTSR